jgi:Sulphur transport
MESSANIVILAALVIGLVYGAVGLVSGFCMMSSLRGWWAEGDGRLVRSYALAMGTAIAMSQLLAASGLVDLNKSIYLQPSFSAPVMFLGGLLFGYGMVLSNGCGSRALVLLGRGNLRSFVVVSVLGIFAEMTLKGLIAPARIAMVQASQTTVKLVSLPALLSTIGLGDVSARMLAASILSAALIIFAFAHAPFRKSPGQIAAGLVVGILVAGGWYATGNLGADDFNPAVDGLDAEFRDRHGVRRVRRQPAHGALDRPLPSRGLHVAAPHAALGRRRCADGYWRRDGVRLLDRAGADGIVDLGVGIVRYRRRNFARHRRWSPRRAPRAAAGCGVALLPRPALRGERYGKRARRKPSPPRSSRSVPPTSACGAPGICRRSPSIA